MAASLLLACLLPAAGVPPRPLLIHNASLLAQTWTTLASTGGHSLGPALHAVAQHAEGHLHTPAFSVTQCPEVPPSGDRHDYMSAGVYWWPCARVPGTGPCIASACLHNECNCSSVDICGKTSPTCNAATGMPWASCDGHENRKSINQGGLPQLGGMSASAQALAAGFYWTRNETCLLRYATRAVQLIEAFFLDPATRMNPNFAFGQSMPGYNNGSGSGLVEIDIWLIQVLEGIALINHPAPCEGCKPSAAWSSTQDDSMLEWLKQWSAWLESSPFSTWACNYRNNHNAACRSSWLAVAAWIGDSALERKIIAGAKERQWTNTSSSSMPYQKLGAANCRGCDGFCTGTCGKAPIGGQIWGDGELPQEAGRVNSVGYTVAEVHNLFLLAQLSRHPLPIADEEDLFEYISLNGSSIRGALDHLLPFALGQRNWSHHTETETFQIYPTLRQAAAVFGNESYLRWAEQIAATGCVGGCAGDPSLLWWPGSTTTSTSSGGGGGGGGSVLKTDDVVLSNLALPKDAAGHSVITGETSVVTVNGTHYVYVNDWGTCKSIDCCESSGGCASCCFVPSTKIYNDTCVFADGHQVVVYATDDLVRWRMLGVALSLADRPKGIEFRPHVIYNQRSRQFVMWYEDRPPPGPAGHKFDSKGYNVAVASSPEGPFKTVASGVKVADVPGDFDLLVDDDGRCYHVQTTTNDPKAVNGFAITELDAAYTAPVVPRHSATFQAPKPAEGPVFFKRNGSYYILGGTTCCACKGGSSIYVFRSEHPLGPWRYVSDVGSAPAPFNPHSDHNYVTKAQASTVFEARGEWVWLGNQWASGRGAVRNSDLLYWSVLRFDAQRDVEQFVYSPNAMLPSLKTDDTTGPSSTGLSDLGVRMWFGPPIALTDNLSWYEAPAIDGYTSIGDGLLLSPWKRGLNFSLSEDNGQSWRPASLQSPGSSSQNFSTIVEGGFVRGSHSSGSLGHNLGTLPVWCNTCVTPSPGLCDPRAAAMCPGLVCNQTHSPLYLLRTTNLFRPRNLPLILGLCMTIWIGRSRYYNVTHSKQSGLSVEHVCRQVGVRGLPRPLRPEFGLASGFTGPSGPAVLADGSPPALVMVWPVKFADSPEHKAPPGSVASSEQLPWSWYGPNEHDIAVLADGKTLVVIFRPDSDGFCPGVPAYRFFYQSYSYNGGVTWTDPRPIPGVGCVRPRLLRLASGPLLLTGGRLCPTLVGNGTRFPAQSCPPTSGGGKGGNYVWLNADGMADAAGGGDGSEWQVQCVTEQHNAGWNGSSNWRFTNNTATQAYNSLQPLIGESSAAVYYEHGWGASSPSEQFMMRIDVAPAKTDE